MTYPDTEPLGALKYPFAFVLLAMLAALLEVWP